MKKFLTLIALVAFAACAQSDPDTYKDPNPTYNRTDALQYDSSYNAHFIVNGASVANMSSTGVLTSAGATSTGNTTITTPVMLLDSIRFCGQGANGTTAQFMGPQVQADMDTDLTYGGAGCDAKDSSTEATADAVWAAGYGFKVTAMMCSVDDGGTDDVYTFQMRDDTADVTGATCSVTLDGSGFDVCTVKLTTPVVIAAGSAIAVEAVAATDDDCSACDQECKVFGTYTDS